MPLRLPEPIKKLYGEIGVHVKQLKSQMASEKEVIELIRLRLRRSGYTYQHEAIPAIQKRYRKFMEAEIRKSLDRIRQGDEYAYSALIRLRKRDRPRFQQIRSDALMLAVAYSRDSPETFGARLPRAVDGILRIEARKIQEFPDVFHWRPETRQYAGLTREIVLRAADDPDVPFSEKTRAILHHAFTPVTLSEDPNGIHPRYESYLEIARKHGISTAGVFQSIHRALKHLADERLSTPMASRKKKS